MSSLLKSKIQFGKESPIQLWSVNLEIEKEQSELLKKFLNEEEKKRCKKFYAEKDRRAYIAAHAALQQILNMNLGLNEALEFIKNEYGKPFLKKYSLQFSLSHSENLAYIVVSPNKKLGVDVEKIKEGFDFQKIAQRFFSKSESAFILSLPPEQQEKAFYQCWVKKEALTKALGLGLSLSLHQFKVPFSLNGYAEFEEKLELKAFQNSWWLQVLSAPQGYQAALALEGEELKVEEKKWEWKF